MNQYEGSYVAALRSVFPDIELNVAHFAVRGEGRGERGDNEYLHLLQEHKTAGNRKKRVAVP